MLIYINITNLDRHTGATQCVKDTGYTKSEEHILYSTLCSSTVRRDMARFSWDSFFPIEFSVNIGSMSKLELSPVNIKANKYYSRSGDVKDIGLI